MNKKIEQAQETLLKLSSLALEYLVSNFHFSNKEYPKLKKEIGNLTDKLRLTLNDFEKYYESQQDLITGKDVYIAKLCNDRSELKAQNKILKEELNAVNDFRTHYKNYQEKLANNLKTINCMQEEETTNYNLIDQLEDRNNRLVERLEKQKVELNDLRKFANICSKKKIRIEGLSGCLERYNRECAYQSAGWHSPYALTENEYIFLKKVVKKHG